MPDYDLLVIGAGSGGVRAARMAAATGAKVAVIEKRYLGGTCVNVGCVPKKLFYYGAHFSETFSEAGHYGWDVKVDDFDWPRLRENKNQEIARLNGIYQRLLEQAGVEIIRGHASLISDTRLEVNGQHISADKILIAVGGAPYVPEFPGSDFVVTSDDVFFLEHLPKRALVVGGGYIAVEFAGIWKGMGVDVDLAYRGQQLLRHFDEDLGKQLAISMYEQGIGLRLGDNVRRIEREAESLKVEFISGEIQSYDVVLYATGRKPYIEQLGLDKAGVALNEQGFIQVDEHFQTSRKNIFALGDVIGTPELTPVALAQAMAFVDTWFKNTPRGVSYELIPTAVFSQPNVATVGLSEYAARQQFDDIVVYESSFRHLKRTLTESQQKTYMKLIVDKSSDKVLGVHMVGDDAGEIIQGFAVALRAGATKAEFDQTVGIHPTAAEEFVTMREASR